MIILDEPTVGLDPRQILDIRDLIRSLGGDHTVILSSHILSEVSAVCDHVLILSGGKLVAQGTPAELERLMRRSNRYHMLVQGTPEAVSAALLAAQKLGTVEVQPDSSGFVGVTMETEEGTDPRAELFPLAGWRGFADYGTDLFPCQPGGCVPGADGGADRRGKRKRGTSVRAIYKKEVCGFFRSMLGYLYIAFMLLVAGIFFTAFNLQGGVPEFGYVLGNTTVVLLVVIPVITMRTLGEEQRQKTDQLLFTAPVTVSSVVLGKFFAVVTVFAMPLIVLLPAR